MIVSALERRAHVIARRPHAARRHTDRVLKRALVLVIGDVLALLAVRAVMRVVLAQSPVAQRLSWDPTTVGPFADPGMPGSMVFAAAIMMALVLTGCYSRHRLLNTSIRLGFAAFIAAPVSAIVLAAVVGVQVALLLSLIAGLVAWVALTMVRIVSETIANSVWPASRGATSAILVGTVESFRSPAARAISGPSSDFRVARVQMNGAGTAEMQHLFSELHGVIDRDNGEVIVVCEALPNGHMRALAELALDAGCRVLYPAGLAGVNGLRPRLVWYYDQPFFEFGAVALKPTAVTIKRITDLVVAAALLAVCWPVMLIIAVGIRLDSKGPVLFAQDRAGLGGQRLRMLKFRTMRHGADAEKGDLAHLNRSGDVRLFKIPVDPRTTRFGRFLRRWSLDELPQLINVLRGDMSLVGPRPFFESDFAAYEDRHFRRLDTKPGITGLWQVSGRSEIVKFEEVVFLDRQYIEQWSFWLDVSILFRTIPAVIRRTGAY